MSHYVHDFGLSSVLRTFRTLTRCVSEAGAGLKIFMRVISHDHDE